MAEVPLKVRKTFIVGIDKHAKWGIHVIMGFCKIIIGCTVCMCVHPSIHSFNILKIPKTFCRLWTILLLIQTICKQESQYQYNMVNHPLKSIIFCDENTCLFVYQILSKCWISGTSLRTHLGLKQDASTNRNNAASSHYINRGQQSLTKSHHYTNEHRWKEKIQTQINRKSNFQHVDFSNLCA